MWVDFLAGVTAARRSPGSRPYNGITVGRPLELLLHAVQEFGLEEFLRREQLKAGRPGPVSVQVYSKSMFMEALQFDRFQLRRIISGWKSRRG